MNNKEIKIQLIKKCERALLEKIKEHEVAMEDAQREANFHKGAMESRYDTFKEEAQERKDAHAKQIAQITKLLSSLISITQKKASEKVEFGSVVETDSDVNYFMFSYIFNTPIVIDNKKFLPINLLTPLGQQFLNKKIGDVVNFKGKTMKIIDVY